MARSGEFNGSLANALQLLDRPEQSSAPELRNAIALVHGAGVVGRSHLEQRYAGSSHVAVHPETGRLMLTEAALAKPQAESWIALAGVAAAKHFGEDEVVLNPKLQVWQAAGSNHRSPSGASGMVRAAEGARQKVDAMIDHPVVRRAMLASVEHTKRGRDPFESYEDAIPTLQTASVQKHMAATAFRDDLTVRESDRMYDAHGTEDGTFVQMTQLLGSYARKLSLRNNQQREQVAAVQSVLVTRQTVFAVDPEYSDELFAGYDLSESGAHELSRDTVDELTTFVDASVDAVVPLSSGLYATQDFRVMNREMY